MFYTTSAAGFSAHTRSESAPELALNFSLFDPSSAMMSLDPVAETANYEALYSDTALDNVSLHETLAHMPQTAHMHPELTRLNTELRVVSNYNMP
ncbi:hypothetical protein BABINDRAFT_161828 [Babjeviella inositovora NRRL Y-12698]|uniref:Uncharacterized protein n=1 Tax=Babjeviella inositovora NRRL Y-12698 TaxID=984486 RepID=A0A1E3QR40_9ASCO|nr:uncharacterized protein BABINDRAFT_161828 [Babjeviella inositovora NRRL Y-12698]ODQ79427.1 hypothetical protein BABINDRAFT_161828 [Babjeviella inositovora NRRL Y-12698]